MVFQPSKPAPPDDLDISVSDIQGNFQTSNTVMAVNHYEFDVTTGDQGKHRFVEMPVNALPTTLAAEGSLYTKASGQTQLFYTSDAGAVEYQMTRAIDANVATFGIASDGWTFLPGGLIMKYGTFLLVPTTPTTYTPPGPAFTNIPTSIVLTINSTSTTNNAALWSNATTTTVDAHVISGTRTVSYMIIGK